MRNPNIQGQIWLVFILHFYSPGYQFILVCGIHFQLNHPLWTRATNRAGAGECQLDTSCALQLQSSCGNFKVWFTVIRIRDCLPSTWHLYLISALLHCKYLDFFWRKKKLILLLPWVYQRSMDSAARSGKPDPASPSHLNPTGSVIHLLPAALSSQGIFHLRKEKCSHFAARKRTRWTSQNSSFKGNGLTNDLFYMLQEVLQHELMVKNLFLASA